MQYMLLKRCPFGQLEGSRANVEEDDLLMDIWARNYCNELTFNLSFFEEKENGNTIIIIIEKSIE